MKDKGHERNITGAASIVGSATVLSRITGYTRDAVVAYVFGAGMASDAFFMAFRISNLLRRLVGEGALTSSFIPIFTEETNVRSKEGVRALVSNVFTLFAIIFVVLAVLGMIFSREIVLILSPGFADDPGKFGLTVTLTRMMFPFMVFIGLMALAMGVLNTMRHFLAPAVSPVLFNLSIIFTVLVITPVLNVPIYAVAIGVLFGGLLQFVLQLPYMKRFGLMPNISFKFNDPAIKKIFILMGPAAFGVGVFQLNQFISLWFSSKLPEGAVSYLYYASRLMELPLGVFGVAISTAALPSLSEYAAKKDWDNFRGSLSFALRIVNFVTIPATFGLFILSYPIIVFLFMRGKFGPEAATGTALALYYYALGLVPVSVSRILTSVFYSLKDTATPVYVAIATLVVNAALCFVLIGPLQHGGLALAATISAAFNAAVLLVILRLRFGKFGARRIMTSSIKSLLAAIIMGAAIYPIIRWFDFTQVNKFLVFFVVPVVVAIGGVVYLVFSKVFKSEELSFLKEFIDRKRTK